ncbi:uncharacterized protein Nmag_1032 [Natrialba magadii ATCC 43099]|uniref:Uncharacterized protein n=1 Tax=Natrialba magadii (strain ATCC 43099 / DSM 3394 / CCM 3739 / CIP 104546 / IAM 13178 / JCM 8861 / NBRC 102185 / NCIMB 2190 / MS3) TaxID=547559 RepID=D3SRB1_NATMM|nr:uncharacterized protein Nmag_1032 [Natrialba magadii ATCC 43099]ELY25272.1 hypothetical protein C500_17681 [Natrialba magadii ATCC 43099]
METKQSHRLNDRADQRATVKPLWPHVTLDQLSTAVTAGTADVASTFGPDDTQRPLPTHDTDHR